MGKLKTLVGLILLLGSNHVFAQSCYCTTEWFTSTTGQKYCVANTTCWACAPGAYDTNWQQLFCSNYVAPAPVVTCQSSFTEKTESCQAHFSGIKKYKQETISCTDGKVTVQPWQLYADTCTPNPPTCRASSETQTLSCQAGYTGSITQVRTSTCPDPYGNPLFGAWATSSDSCVKSLTNPTNVMSPVSPINPVTSAVSTTITPVLAPVVSVPTMTQPTDTQEAPTSPSSSASPSQTSTETSDAPSAVNSAPAQSAGNGAKAAALVQKLDMIGAIPKQPTIIETLTMTQEMPDDIRRQQDFLLDLIANDDYYGAIGSDQRARFGGILWSNPLQQGYGGD